MQSDAKFREAPIAVPEALLSDLRGRLTRIRWPEALGQGWELGTDPDYLRALMDYWSNGFDWRVREAQLEALLPSYRTRVAGLELHFALRPGKGPNPFPLLLLHGWPGSHFEFSKVAGPLADPAAHGADPLDAFDLVIRRCPVTDSPTRPPIRTSTRTTGHC